MRRILESNTRRVEILRLHERDAADVPMRFGDRLLTLDFLRVFMRDPMNMMTLRNALAEVFPVMDISRLTDDETLQRFSWQIADRYFELVLRVEGISHLVGVGAGESSEAGSEADSEAAGGADETAQEAPVTSVPAAPIAPQEERDWIEFRIVDDETDLPMPGIELKIKLPTGETKDYTTDANGIVHIDDLTSGTCDIVEMTDPDASEVVRVE